MKGLRLAALGALLVGLTIACVVAGDGDLNIALAPTLVIGFLIASWRLPLRWPLLVMTFLALTLENPSDVPACGQWKSPLYEVGAVLLIHMNVTLPNKALVFSGLDVFLVVLVVVAAVRALNGSRIDGPPASGGTGPIRWFAALTLAGAAWMWI